MASEHPATTGGIVSSRGSELHRFCRELCGLLIGGHHFWSPGRWQSRVAWGDTTWGQLSVPTRFEGVLPPAAASAGDTQHSLALKSDGTVVAWGDNTVGQVVIPNGLSDVTRRTHHRLPPARSTLCLEARRHGQVARGIRRPLWQDGNSLGTQRRSPLSPAGTHHNLALKKDGTVIGWGRRGLGHAALQWGSVALLPSPPEVFTTRRFGRTER